MNFFASPDLKGRVLCLQSGDQVQIDPETGDLAFSRDGQPLYIRHRYPNGDDLFRETCALDVSIYTIRSEPLHVLARRIIQLVADGAWLGLERVSPEVEFSWVYRFVALPAPRKG